LKNYLIFIGCIILFSACGGSDTAKLPINAPLSVEPSYQQPNAAICDASLDVEDGLLCAIQPSRLDSNSRDEFGVNSNEDYLLGFGFHAVAFPKNGSAIRGVNIHLTGSYGRPYNQFSGNFPSKIFLNESLAAGYITIQVAYDNRYAINLDQCGGSPEKFGIDNCAGDVRLEKITGQNISSVTDTPLEDSIEYRLIKLISYFENQGVIFPINMTNSGSINWNQLSVSGHSQGGGHALYLGKYFDAAYVCMLAAGFDVPDSIPALPEENIADWFLDDSIPLDINKIRALVSIDDDSYSYLVTGYEVLDLQQGVHYQVFSGAPYFNSDGNQISGHGAAIADPRYQSLRREACFP